MKKWQILLGALCISVSSLTAFAADEPAKAEPAAAIVLTDPTVNVKNLDDFYILKGSTYDKVTGLLQNLPSQTTGLVGSYYSASTRMSSAITFITSRPMIRYPTSS